MTFAVPSYTDDGRPVGLPCVAGEAGPLDIDDRERARTEIGTLSISRAKCPPEDEAHRFACPLCGRGPRA